MELMNKTIHRSNVLASTCGKVAVHTGAAAFELLADTGFQKSWDELYKTCPWGTVFQSRGFVATWYQLYQMSYMPVLVTCLEHNKLTGLLAMAKDKKGGIIGAGANQAEYQVWLAAAFNKGFIQKALSSIRYCFPWSGIQFKYIPSKAPITWIINNAAWKNCCVVRKHQQPLLRLDEAAMDKELKKKNRREKVNRLNRLGVLQFERITDNTTFVSILDQLVLQYDFRQGARYNKTFFQADPLRKTFLSLLFEQNLLHATVLKLDNTIIASNVGVKGKGLVHLQGVNTHDPFYAKYSPGILHFLMLGKQLAQEKIEVFDLTPGKDPYKESLANDFSTVYELYIGSAFGSIIKRWSYRFSDLLKVHLTRMGVKESEWRKTKERVAGLKDQFQHIRYQGLIGSIKSVVQQLRAPRDYMVFTAPVDKLLPRVAPAIKVRENSLGDLLLYEARGSWITRWAFLQAAMRRLEVGERCYTWCREDRLLACAWLSNKEEKTAQLQEFYCHPDGREQYGAFVAAVTAAVAGSTVQQVQAVVPANDTTTLHHLQAIGFQCIGS